MDVLLIRDLKQGRQPELREKMEVCEIDITMIDEDGLDGEIRIFKQDGAIQIYFPKKLEVVLNPGGDAMANLNLLEMKRPS